jgi:hypothetical protein
MVIDIMLYLPIVSIPTQYVEKISRDGIDPGIPGKTLMTSFMHYIEANDSQINP